MMNEYMKVSPALIEITKNISISTMVVMIDYVIPHMNEDFTVRLNVPEIANELEISPATIYRAIQNLLKVKILTNTKEKYIYQVTSLALDSDQDLSIYSLS